MRPEVAAAQQGVGLAPSGRLVAEGQPPAARIDQRHPRSFYGVLGVDPDRLVRDAGRVAQELLVHLSALVGTDIAVDIEIRASNCEGFPEELVRLIAENSSALRLRIADFEDRP